MSEITTLGDEYDCYDPGALLERLTSGVKASGRPVAFLVGSALTAPLSPGQPGVPSVDGVIDLIEQEFDDERRQELARDLAGSENRYQTAFRFLLGRRSQQAANKIIRRAIGAARVPGSSSYEIDGSTSDESCRAFDVDESGWALTPGVQALGELAARYPELFGRTILTTNFDPLIGAAIRRAGGTAFRTVLHRDGNLAQADGAGSHVIHLHGYWYGSDTLHTPRQLNQPRPQLRTSLLHLLRDRTVVVLAYGGWDDAFTQALVDVVLDDNAYPEVIWCFRDRKPRMRAHLLNTLLPGIDRGRVSLYGGVDCNIFLPSVVDAWSKIQAPKRSFIPSTLLPPTGTETQFEVIQKPTIISNLGAAATDRPPIVSYYVGREREMFEVESSPAKVTFVTGIGGQGKSALIASYFNSSRAQECFDYRVWRDCKEQGERFEDQLILLIEALNNDKIDPTEISKQPINVLADLFSALTENIAMLVVFDNVDHYVDLETNSLAGAAGKFVGKFIQSKSKVRVIFTCRPEIIIDEENALSIRLEGLDLEPVKQLFRLRHAPSSEESIERAHRATNGHALWLDLLAAQVAVREPQVHLDDLIATQTSESSEIPDNTLRSIWNILKEREKIVLQALAETLKPTTDLQLSSYLGSRCRFNQMVKALRVLRTLSLVVVKELDGGKDGFELHPVIRAFIRKTFKRAERISFIDAILAYYSAFFGTYRAELSRRPDSGVVAHWLEGAELCVNAGHYKRAFEHLNEVREPIRRSEPPGEFIRVALLLFTSLDVKTLTSFSQFDDVYTDYVECLIHLGRVDSVIEALERYQETLDGKDARYINFCNMQATLHWTSGNYSGAIKWGSEGAELKKSSGVDTKYSSEHTLALAQRDSGAIDAALEYFLDDVAMDEVLCDGPPDDDRSGEFYGNIGRCLQLMNQSDSALICYKKSAAIIEHRSDFIVQENQAYIREWIGEVMLARGDTSSGLAFMIAALHKWAVFSPPRADRVKKIVSDKITDSSIPVPSVDAAESYVLRWISHV